MVKGEMQERQLKFFNRNSNNQFQAQIAIQLEQKLFKRTFRLRFSFFLLYIITIFTVVHLIFVPKLFFRNVTCNYKGGSKVAVLNKDLLSLCASNNPETVSSCPSTLTVRPLSSSFTSSKDLTTRKA